MTADEREALKELIRSEPNLLATFATLNSEIAACESALAAAQSRHDLELPPLQKRHDELSRKLASIRDARAKLVPQQPVKTGEPAPLKPAAKPSPQKKE